ncbi:MAG: HAD family phosphatase [Erysipelotrichaceae bacterium]|nr:HAD family phosphatase [Erysipelotrichaceae bacterium]
MNYHGVIFDFNGTLFFDTKYHKQVWKQIAETQWSLHLSDEEIQQHFLGKNNETIIDAFADRPLTREENKQLSEKKEAMYRELCRQHPETSNLAPGAEKLFDFLKANHIPMTIASASIKANIDFYVEYFRLDQWMDPQTITFDDGTYEDKRGMFTQAAKNIGCDISECLIFEDSISGIRFAHDVKAKAVIAINSEHDNDRYQAFPFLLGIYHDFNDFDFHGIFS